MPVSVSSPARASAPNRPKGARRPRASFAGVAYATLKEARSAVKAFVAAHGCGDVAPTDPGYRVLLDVFRRHPEYAARTGGLAPLRFTVRRNPLNRKALHVEAVLADGYPCTVSVSGCCTVRGWTARHRLVAALRERVDQPVPGPGAPGAVCAGCGAEGSFRTEDQVPEAAEAFLESDADPQTWPATWKTFVGGGSARVLCPGCTPEPLAWRQAQRGFAE